MTPIQPRTHAARSLWKGMGELPDDGAILAAIEAEAVSEYREALRELVAEVGSQRIDGNRRVHLGAWIKARLLLDEERCQCGHTRADHDSRYDAPGHCTHRCVPPWLTKAVTP